MTAPDHRIPGEPGLRDARAPSEWRRPHLEASGLQRYVHTVRERLRMVLLTVLATALAAGTYLAIANETYEAEADLLVTPVASDEPVLTSLGLIRESNDPTRDVETAARLVTTRDVAQRVRGSLGLDRSATSLLEDVDAEPVAQSNIVAVTAQAGSATLARDIANAFATEVVADRREELRRQLDEQIPRLRQQLAVDGRVAEAAAEQLAQLESLRSSGDPTLRVETRAAAPSSPVAPRPVLTMAAGILAGLILGIGGAFAMHAVDPRLRREEQLRERYSIPVLARIPREKRARTAVAQRDRLLGIGPRRKRRRALAPGQLSPATSESYRTLRAMLSAARPDRPSARSVLVTGPSPSEGKTTTAINLASSLALAGNRVILIEADFRRPTVGEALGVRPRVGLGKVLIGRAGLEEALLPARPFGDNLRLLLVAEGDRWLAEALSLPTAAALLEEAERLADFVVIDSPPLTEVIDALPLAQRVGDVVLVVRLGYSNLGQLGRLGDLLAQNDIKPTGFVVVGVGSSEEESYYLASRRTQAEELFRGNDVPQPARLQPRA